MNNDKPYSIGAAAQITGLSTQVIRIWEHRYKAVMAERAPNGRRIYKATEIEKLGLLKALTDRGVSISKVANLPAGELREKLAEIDQMAITPMSGVVRVATLGACVTDLFSREVIPGNPVDLVCSDTNANSLAADLRHLEVDVLVIEVQNLDDDCRRLVEKLRQAAGRAEVIMTYAFARTTDEKELATEGIRLLRTPLSADALAIAVLAAAAQVQSGERQVPPAAIDRAPKPPTQSPPPARQFSPQDLLRLSSIETGVDCECPHHLADLIQTLNAFEVYSANCESRDAQDAALHAQLHRTTAQARSLMEEALIQVMNAEAITL